jgi:putative FmdB family regulatory protein
VYAITPIAGEVPMPVYDYLCRDCHKTFELILSLHEHDEVVKCPHCGSKNVEQEPAAFFAVTSSKS